jgi:ferredoxin-NADP reductase
MDTSWEPATIVAIKEETATAKTIRLQLARPSMHLAGQHYVVRLTAADGYSASRSYSVATPPDGSDVIDLTIHRLPEGEVSTFLHDEAIVGDELEVRGPVGTWFVWRANSPALLIGGGSGVVSLMAMLRLARRLGHSQLVHLLVSVRTPADLCYADELPGPESTVIYSREAPPNTHRPPGHLTAQDLGSILDPDAAVFICGSSTFADAASDALLLLGVSPARIRVERFGASG